MAIAGWGVAWGKFTSATARNKKDIDQTAKETKETMDSMAKRLKEEYLTGDKHTDLCKIVSLEMMEHVSKTIKESEKRIVDAINGKQIRFGVIEAMKQRDGND